MENELRQLWKLAFGDTEAFLDGFFSTAYSPDRCRYLTVDGTVAAALYWFDCQCFDEKYAYLYAVATHPDFRGRGLCRKLMARTHKQLKEQGYAGCLLVPQEEGLRTFYGKMGYHNMGNVAEFTAVPGEKPAPLGEIVAEEYAALRRRYLPRGSVVQEGENLRFLARQARFYAGEDFLLAGNIEDGFLWAMELLGSAEAAPGILKALGCVRGRFRTPGEALPFAMFLPLQENAPAPQYFGHAFD